MTAAVRVGPWQEAEDHRLLRGLQEVMRVRSFEEAYQLTKVPWLKIFPYVRVSGYSNI